MELTVAANEMEAQMIAGLLRVNGIVSNIQPTNTSAAVFGATLAGGGAMSVWVADADAVRARELLAAQS